MNLVVHEMVNVTPTICLDTVDDTVVNIPTRATENSAGYDLYAAESRLVLPNSTALIRTGVRIAIPNGFFGMVASRSGLGVNEGLSIAQGVGIIDSDYRGEVMVPLYNRKSSGYEVRRGDRIAQIIFISYQTFGFKVVGDPDDLPSSSRGEGGFGSSGK